MALAAERFAVAAARQAYEAALRDLRSAEAHADFWREDDGSFRVVDQGLNPEIFAEIQQLQPALDAASATAGAAEAAHEQALQAYGEAARQSPLFETDNVDPVLLLPVRLEAIYFDNDGAPELRIRVYPDDVHVDSHEPALTERERGAGVAYWRAARAAGGEAAGRQAAWQALVAACGARAPWVRDALTPLDASPGEPKLPKVEIRPEAWTRAARTQLLPDRFEFSAYRDGALAWRRAGAPIPDSLAIGIAPQPGDGEAEPDALAFDEESRWLVDFNLAVTRGMAIVAALADADERFDLLTVVGVGVQDGETGTRRVQSMLAAHAFSDGLSPLPVRTPTNNTPATRSGWRSRGAPTDPDVVAQWRAAFDPGGDQEAARLARALGVDGTTVLASTCDPAGGDEALLRRLHELQADFYSWSRAFRPAADTETELTRCTEPWFLAVAEHYTRFVRARSPLPPLRIGRQPYGLLPISSTGLWRDEDVDARISRFVGSFLTVFAERASRAPQIGEQADQDAVLLDLLSREASPRGILEIFDFTIELKTNGRPPTSTVGAIPATSSFAWLHADKGPGPDDPGGNPSSRIEPFPDVVPDSLKQIAAEHPLAQLLVLFDESLQRMRDTQVPPDPHALAATYEPLSERLSQLLSPPTRSLFYRQAEWSYNWLYNVLSSGPEPPDQVAERVVRGTEALDLFAAYAALEDDASADLGHFERLFRETLEPLSNRVDAWVSSLATARLAGIRKRRPAGIRTGAYGWLTDVEPGDPNPGREGYVVTPSMHHATTAAVLRSGWQAHSDRRAFAVDIQSARARRALAMVEGVRAGETVGALLGYQFERALHDARLDRFIAGFRSAYPLAQIVDPEAPGGDEARVAIGARNVVDGQALRGDRRRLQDDVDLEAAGGAALDGDAPTIRRILGELDETFDALGDLLLAESVHQLAGGNPQRAGLAADAVGRGQELPLDYDVLRTPRGGIGATHHVGILFADSLPDGWSDDRPLARLQPGLEGWLRRRLGPASAWALGAPPAELGWCALDLLIAPAEQVRGALAVGSGDLDEDAFTRLMLLCERLRSALSTAAPLTPAHLDPADPSPVTGYDLDDLHDRVGGWLSDVRAAAADLASAATAEAAEPIVRRLGALGLPVGLGGAGDIDRIRALLSGADLSERTAPPDSADHPSDADAWITSLLATTGSLLHPAVKVAPTLVRELPPSPRPAAGEDTVAGWLQDTALVRPGVDALDGACVAAEIIAGAPAAAYFVAQSAVAAEDAAPWIALAAPTEGPRARSSLVMQRDGGDGDRLCGLVVDSWTEVVPRAPGEHGPEEVVGVAFDFDRPGARAPQAMLVAVPPDLDRGWCMEDLHACLDEALLLARIRTLDLEDLPELRTVLPIPNGEG
jgi:hypothetical protein